MAKDPVLFKEKDTEDHTKILLEYTKLHDKIKQLEEKKHKIYIQAKELAMKGKLIFNSDKVSAELVTSNVRLRWKEIARNSLGDEKFNELETKDREECTNLKITKIVKKGEFKPQLVE